MKEKKHELDNTLKQAFKENTLDTPSIDFTTHLMSKIYALEAKESFSYTSVIPNWIKICIATILLSIIVYFSFNADFESSIFLSEYIQIPEWSINLPSYQFNMDYSNIILYGCLFFMLLFAIQIYFIKNKLNSIKF